MQNRYTTRILLDLNMNTTMCRREYRLKIFRIVVQIVTDDSHVSFLYESGWLTRDFASDIARDFALLFKVCS